MQFFRSRKFCVHHNFLRRGSVNHFLRQFTSSKKMDITVPNTLSAGELIEIVDENNNPVEPQYRYIMRRDKLIHRATYAFIKTSSNYFYVQKRSNLKDYCPNFYDPNPGGVVAAGESYEVTNEREVAEEMGIENTQWNHLFTFYYEDHRTRCFGDAWETTYDGPIQVQKEEVQFVEFMSMDEILARSSSGEDFTPDSIVACQEYIKLKGNPPAIGEKPDLVYKNQEK